MQGTLQEYSVTQHQILCAAAQLFVSFVLYAKYLSVI